MHDNAASGKNPELEIVLFGLHLKFGGEDVSTTSHGGNVDWAVIETCGDLVLSLDGSNMNNWELGPEFLGDHFCQVTLFGASTEFPRSTLKEESMDVATILWNLLDIV